MMPGHPSPRRTAQQKRMSTFEEAVYRTLREYQDGDYAATSGVVAGCLDVALAARAGSNQDSCGDDLYKSIRKRS